MGLLYFYLYIDSVKEGDTYSYKRVLEGSTAKATSQSISEAQYKRSEIQEN
jgi:hypothetical protein